MENINLYLMQLKTKSYSIFLEKPDSGSDVWKKKHDLVFMKIAEKLYSFFSLLKPDHGFDIREENHNMVSVRAIKK